MTEERLESLKKKKQVLEAQIRQEQNKLNGKRRKADTRRKILAGAVVLEIARTNKAYKDDLYGRLDKFLVRSDDRALFGLPPLPNTPTFPQKPSTTAEKQSS